MPGSDKLLTNKVFINKDNKAVLVCPQCGKEKIVDASQYKQIGSTVRLRRRCSCGYTYIAHLERRKFYRKNVNIPGKYRHEKDTVKYEIIIMDLSRSGLKFETNEAHTIEIGDKLFMEFQLDNKQHTLIKKDVFVRIIRGNEIGTEFCSRNLKNPYDKAYDMAIGFYTFP